MSISITLDQTTRIAKADDDSDLYIVENLIAAATNISMALFVYKASTQDYSHIATQYDLANYPETLAEALAQNLEYYRESSANREFTSVYLARDFASVVTQRLHALVQDTSRTAANFNVGKQSYTYTAGA